MATTTQAIYGVVQREGVEKGFWTRIGSGLRNQDGSWNLRFDYLLSDPIVRVQMRRARSGEPGQRSVFSPGGSGRA